MNDLSTTIDTYLEAYGEPDAGRRIALIEQVWAPDGHLFAESDGQLADEPPLLLPCRRRRGAVALHHAHHLRHTARHHPRRDRRGALLHGR